MIFKEMLVLEPFPDLDAFCSLELLLGDFFSKLWLDEFVLPLLKLELDATDM